jgi:hypothetical protein
MDEVAALPVMTLLSFVIARRYDEATSYRYNPPIIVELG